ncbi:hypothetical protein VTJ04DRAFT_2307 [Mycothermus thermophilus]|uniref:uncharacterized protein n=1 Tax=Humicola insolens TaxID=85995 RepID=UPI0037431D18
MARGRIRTADPDPGLAPGMESQPSSQGTPAFQPVPNHETQQLYNLMRQAQEQERLRRHIQEADQNSLQPPTLSQCSPPSPTSSYQSTTRSVTNNVDDLGLDHHQPEKRQRGRRKGGLSEYKKHKAALMRKIGVCPSCKKSRTSCTHHDFTLFENNYRLLRERQRPRAQPRRPHPPRHAHLSHFDPQRDLLFIGTHTGPEHRVLNDPQNFGGEDIDLGLLGGVPSWGNAQHINRLVNTIQGQGSPNLPYLSVPASPNISYSPALPTTALSSPQISDLPVPDQTNGEILVGRQYAFGSEDWICLGDGGHRPMQLEDGLLVCGLQYPNLDDLKRHFNMHHMPVTHERFSWKCIGCREEFGNVNPSRPCISCSGSRTWRQYCYAKQDTQSNNPSLLFGSSTQTYDDSPSTQSSYLSQVWNRGSGPTNSNNASAYCQYDGSPYGSHTYSRGGTIDPSSAKKIVDASETKPPPPAATPCQARHRQQYCHPQHLLSSLAGGFLFSVLHREKPNHAHCAGNARSSPAPLWSSFPGHHTPVHTTLLLAIVLFLLLFIAIAALTSNLAGPDTVDSWPPLACVLTGLGASCLYHRHVRGRESVVGDRKGGLGHENDIRACCYTGGVFGIVAFPCTGWYGRSSLWESGDALAPADVDVDALGLVAATASAA